MRPRSLVVLCAVCVAIVPRSPAQEALPFAKHTIDDAFPGGYQVSAADIDGDAAPDVIALSTNPAQLVWYRNPNWERYTIATRTENNIDLAPYDIDRDGDTDIALASSFDLGDSTHGGNVQWLEHPDDPKATQEWPIHPIDAVPTSHRLRWASLDGTGTKCLLNLPIIGVGAAAPNYTEPLVFKSYTIPTNPRTDPWPARIVDNTLAMAHGMRVVDWDRDGRDEILTASFDGVNLYRWKGSAFGKERIGAAHTGERPKIGSSEVALGALGSEDMRFVAAIEPWHGNEVVVYREPSTRDLPWPRTVIDDTLADGHALTCVDIDADSNDEIVAGGRGGAHDLLLFRWNRNTGAWTRHTIDAGGMGAAGLVIADINSDNHPDLVAIGTATHNVVWYENTTRKP